MSEEKIRLTILWLAGIVFIGLGLPFPFSNMWFCGWGAVCFLSWGLSILFPPES